MNFLLNYNSKSCSVQVGFIHLSVAFDRVQLETDCTYMILEINI